MLLPNHGANPQLLANSLKISLDENSIDFSVNVNPYPALRRMKDMWSSLYEDILQYPDPFAELFVQFVSEKEGLNADQILAGNGAAELIFLIAQAYRGSNVLIAAPAFSEYEDACEVNDCNVDFYVTRKEKGWKPDLQELNEKLHGKQLCFLCNPNNPTGTVLELNTLEAIVALCECHHVTLVVDEAFVHFLEKPVSAVQLMKKYSNLIVLRSLTKMFHLPGLRLGYAMSSKEQIGKLRRFQPPWSVNGPAQKLGILCLEQEECADEIVMKTAVERERIFPILDKLGFETSPSTVNFYLLRESGEENVQLALIKYLMIKGMIVRHTFNFRGLDGHYIRLAIRTPEENDRLLAALEGWKAR
ncbi:threonine-phosphate decarboxylase CobD [Fictibacillus sp. B-59209]|uniref:threonine-phosphate decarboxylase CobD n=1 Tax=Fictibacillus sp. B-59209 TaxID=3024873 RepID=UPI002E1F0756|nr:threonine-phosphate decarboxylase CobD [Fictibacillus sp. B-59209]